MKDKLLAYIIIGGCLTAVYFLRKNKTTSKNENSKDNMNTSYYPNGSYSLSRGYRNNNPLNIVYSAKNDWSGQIVPSTDSRFAQFQSMEYGYRAAFRLLRTYINSYGANTIQKIISRWAPENENDTSSYINSVSRYTGIDPNVVLTESDARIKKIVEAMSIVENGNKYSVPLLSLENGWKLYLNSI